MNYEIMTMEKKTIVGLKARTANADPEMGAVIGGLWQQLYGEGKIGQIMGRVNDHAIGLYSDYENGAAGAYDITVGCEVKDGMEAPEGMTVKTIPAGRYARFVLFGDMVKAVAESWEEIWKTDLCRSYTGDYEEYVSTKENGESEIHIYIALK